ncbi:MAG TPA: hypothetical protein VFV38_32765 [Ktedonobacteraceae bacterium]|nr:hypothetical protein [Ktedonobacteraceae bacterium]
MTFIGDGTASDIIQVIPQNLRDSVPPFQLASSHAQDMVVAVSNATTVVAADMYLLVELARFAQAIEDFLRNWQTSMQCLSDAEDNIAIRLEQAAEGYEFNEAALVNQWRNRIATQSLLPYLGGNWQPGNHPPLISPSPQPGFPISPEPGEPDWPQIIINP